MYSYRAFQSDTEEILSIVLSGRRKNDQDYGDWIVYTGTDDSSINSKDDEEMHDQTLEGLNLMLAHCCAAPINTKRGSHAHENWLQGRPIRVIRGSEFPLGDGSSQTYMPYTGFRYDGVYKVVQYKPRKGSQGNRVWQFAMRRCDSSPAPWTKKDKYIKTKGKENNEYSFIISVFTTSMDETTFSPIPTRSLSQETQILDIHATSD